MFLMLTLIITVAFSSLTKTKPIEASEPIAVSNLVGELEVIHYDDFENPANSRYEYYLKALDGNEYRLHAPNEDRLVPNTKIVIKEGIIDRNDLYGEASRLYVSIEAIPSIIPYNTGTFVKWQAEEATSCIGSGGYNGWAGPKSVDGGTFITGKLTSNITYTITCQNAFDTISDSVTVTVLNNHVDVDNHVNNVMTAYTPTPTEPTPYDLAVFMLTPQGATESYTPSEVDSWVFNGPINNFFVENSFNKKYLSGDTFGWIELASTECPTAFESLISLNEFTSYIDTNSIELENYDHVVFLVNCGSGGVSTLGIKQYTVNGESYLFSISKINASSNTPTHSSFDLPIPFSWTRIYDTMTHELGHAFGVNHSQGLDCGAVSIGSGCQVDQYGNLFDVMGRGTYALHNNAFHKNIMGWLHPSQKLNITSSGTYSINPLETSSGIKQIDIWNPLIPDTAKYTVENRRSIGFDATLNNPEISGNQNGLFINRYGDVEDSSFTRLIDTTPTPTIWEYDTRDAALVGSNVFTDIDRGITIGPITGVTANKITFDVTINPNLPTCTHANPTISVPSTFTFDTSNETIALFKTNVYNADNVTCGPSMFRTQLLPVGFNLNIPYANVDREIKPSQTNEVQWFDANIENLAPGVYNFETKATNLDFPQYNSTVPIVITVVP